MKNGCNGNNFVIEKGSLVVARHNSWEYQYLSGTKLPEIETVINKIRDSIRPECCQF